MKQKVIVLASGGLDSTTALYDAAARLEVAAALSFDYGAKHNARELPCAALHCGRLGVPHLVVKLDFINTMFTSNLLKSGGEVPNGHYADATMRSTVVPFRNGVMLSIAAGIAESRGAHAVLIGAHSGDHPIYPDCRPTFLDAMAEALRLGTYAEIRLLRPFIAMDKAAIVRRGLELGVDFGSTWSCYKGRALHCGKCGTCVERRQAFLDAGAPDPTAYEQG